MRNLIIGIVMAFGPIAAAADTVCDELWFVRNEVFNRAGYCFGSTLGQAVFDNRDCTTQSPVLDQGADQLVVDVRNVEAELSCDVDTSRRMLDLPFLAARQALDDLAVPTGFESGCIGWRGAPLPLMSGRGAKSRQTGTILPGTDFLMAHITVDGWEFIDLGNGQMGWMPYDAINNRNCTGLAG